VRVALFITCFNDTLFPQTGRAVVTLLERLGCEVDFPEAQTCCGQMHVNTGYQERGLALARRFERVFADAEWWFPRRRRVWPICVRTARGSMGGWPS